MEFNIFMKLSKNFHVVMVNNFDFLNFSWVLLSGQRERPQSFLDAQFISQIKSDHYETFRKCLDSDNEQLYLSSFFMGPFWWLNGHFDPQSVS